MPHVSPHILHTYGFSALKILSDRDLVNFYDDGMTSISSKSNLYLSAYIPQHFHINSWDYLFLRDQSFRQHVKPLSSINKALSLLKQFPSLYDFSIKRESHEQIKSSELISISKLEKLSTLNSKSGKAIILSSKSLEETVVFDNLKQEEFSEIYYVPHYRPTKNNQKFMELKLFNHSGFVEYSLLNLCLQTPLLIFHGVTSTVILLTEFLLRQDKSINVKFVFCSTQDYCRSADRQEYVDYIKVLEYYSLLHVTASKGIKYSI
jgi:hypothetical protein